VVYFIHAPSLGSIRVTCNRPIHEDDYFGSKGYSKFEISARMRDKIYSVFFFYIEKAATNNKRYTCSRPTFIILEGLRSGIYLHDRCRLYHLSFYFIFLCGEFSIATVNWGHYGQF
jgi:hypothetical protein